MPSPALQVLEHLPPTLELLVNSMALAIIIGMLLVLFVDRSQGGIAKRLLCGFVLALRCIPFFWLVIVSQMLAAIYIGDWIFGIASSNRFSLADHIAHLIVPACVLALAQIPIVVQALEPADSPSSQKISAPFFTVLRALAVRLPEVIAACFITEIAFGWPGEGRLFLTPANAEQPALAIDVVLLTAVLTVLLRSALRLATSTGLKYGEAKDA